jgi:hypothetical protein
MAQLKLFSISELVGRLSQASAENRHDQVVRNVHAIFEDKMQKSPDSIVSSQDLLNVYSTFAGMDSQSRFRDYFDDVFRSDVTASDNAQENGLVFSRDTTLSEDYRPTAIEVTQSFEQQVKDASLSEIKNVVAGVVDRPQFSYQGYTKVANVGGFANWKVAFETGHGIAEIAVPVIITDDAAHAPKNFSAADGKHDFTPEGVQSFARNYMGDRRVAGGNSGLDYLGDMAFIPLSQIVDEVDTREPLTVSIASEFTPIDETLTAKLEDTEQSTIEAISGAREAALDKATRDARGNKTNSNLQVTYAGAVRFEDMPNDAANFNGIIAFNATRKGKFGTKTITIPVEVKGGVKTASTFVDQSNVTYELNADAIDNFFAPTGEEQDASDVEAFGDAFLASVASYTELTREMKDSIYNGNLKRANACIKAISNRFDDETLKNAMADYLEYVKDAHIKRNGLEPKKADWHTEMNDQYDGSIKSSSIILN